MGAVGLVTTLPVLCARLEPPEDPAASLAGGSRREGEVVRCFGDQLVAGGGRLRWGMGDDSGAGESGS